MCQALVLINTRYSEMKKIYIYITSLKIFMVQFSEVHLGFFFLKKYLNIYLFIWLHQVFVAAGGLLSCGPRAPQLRLASSLVAAHGLLSCGNANSQLQHACGIQFPDQGSNPGPLLWERGVLSREPLGRSLGYFYSYIFLRSSQVHCSCWVADHFHTPSPCPRKLPLWTAVCYVHPLGMPGQGGQTDKQIQSSAMMEVSTGKGGGWRRSK